MDIDSITIAAVDVRYVRARNIRHLKAMVKTHRCDWCGTDPLVVRYHDEEWGVPEHDSIALFERLILEGMQAGLAWITVLRKRERMRETFLGFDPVRLAATDEQHVGQWLADPGIIRHRGKLEAMVANARAMLEMTGSLDEFLWSFVGNAPQQNHWQSLKEIPAQTATSASMAKALKRLGFRFVGPTTCYAFMQSAGLVNDHLVACPANKICADLAL